ncbi:MAG TPA: hypothetical protein VFM93_12235 [Candidatus Limnocylindria bacterium]|nr:hypothetical protein [Candidatus Limnocylindria bacterium]
MSHRAARPGAAIQSAASVVGLVALAHAAAAIALEAPVAGFTGADAVALLYVWCATFIGVALFFTARTSLPRALTLAYVAMGAAGAVTLAIATAAYFPEGRYIKAGGPIGLTVLTLIATNAVAGTLTLWLGVRRSLGDAVLGTIMAGIFAVFAIPLFVPMLFVLDVGRRLLDRWL